MPLTADCPKCFAQVSGKRILDWAVEALAAGGLREVVFIGGWQIDRVRAEYPAFSFRHNVEWERNNILASLFCAEDAMDAGFVCSYADILYRPRVIAQLMQSPHDITLAVDTDWRARYAQRTEHPEDDGEKVRAEGDRVVQVARELPAAAAQGEYLGVARFTAAGAQALRAHYAEVRAQDDGQPFRGAASLEQAYLILMFQELIDRGVPVHMIATHGGYLEVDTTQDYWLAQEQWKSEQAI